MMFIVKPNIKYPTELIPPESVLSREQVVNEMISLMQLTPWIQIEEDTIAFLAKRRLLANSSHCQKCQRQRELRILSRIMDKYQWKCPLCRSLRSIRFGSCFYNSQLALHQLVMFTYCWARNMPLKDIAWECDIMSEHTLNEWASFLRDVCQRCLLVNQGPIGGVIFNEDGEAIPKEVEVDQSYFPKNKFNPGPRLAGQWIMSGVERQTGVCFMVEVPNRSRQTLEEVIVENIRPGTHIFSDGWAGYGRIHEIGGGIYSHTVNDCEGNFVDPIFKRIHEQNIEKPKVQKKKTGRREPKDSSEHGIPSDLAEHMWRRVHIQHGRLDLFCVMLACIGDQNTF